VPMDEYFAPVTIDCQIVNKLLFIGLL